MCSSCINAQDLGATRPRTSALLHTANRVRAALLLTPCSVILFENEGQEKSCAAFFWAALFPQPPRREVCTGTQRSQTFPNRLCNPKSCQPLFSRPKQKAGQTLAPNHMWQSQKGLKHLKSWINGKSKWHFKIKVQVVSGYFKKMPMSSEAVFPSGRHNLRRGPHCGQKMNKLFPRTITAGAGSF